MSLFDRNLAVFKDMRPVYTRRRSLILGRYDSNGVLESTVNADLEDGYVWVHDNITPRIYSRAKNLRTEYAVGLGVIVEYNNDTREDEVTGVDTVTAPVLFGAAAAGLNSPRKSANTPTPTTARDIIPGGVFADSGGGLNVRVGAYKHEGGYWANGSYLTLTPTATSSKKSFAVVGVNRVTNALTFTLTADRPTAFTLVANSEPTSYAQTDIQAVIDAAPETDWRGAVELTNGDTTINAAKVIPLNWDRPQFVGADGSTAGKRGLVPKPAATDNVKYLRGDATWAAIAVAFTAAGDSGSSQTVSSGDTLTIAGGVGLASVAGATDTITLNLDIPSLTADATPDGAADYVVTYDASASTHKKVLLDDLPGGGGTFTGDATDVPYTPTTSGDWSSAPTEVGGALDTLAADLAAVSGGGSTHSYLGYDTVGGTTEQTTAYRWIMKKITVSSAGILQSIGVYLKTRSDGATPTLTTCIWEDNSGTPRYIYGGSSPVTMNPDHVSGVGGNAARWIQYPTGIYLPTGDYWIGVQSNNNTVDLYKDGSGADRYFTSTFAGWEDAGFRTITTTTDRYSIRASFLAL